MEFLWTYELFPSRDQRFAKALYLLSGTEGSNPSLTVVLSAFSLQWLIYGLSTPQSPRRNEAQRNARKCQKSFKFFSSAKTLGKPGKCVHKGPAFFTVRRTANRSYTSRPGRAVERMINEAFRETMVDVEARMETRVRGADEQGSQRNENRITGKIVYAAFVHIVSRPIDGIPDPHYDIHGYVFNAIFDPVEESWKAGQFMNLKADAPFFEAAFDRNDYEVSPKSRGSALKTPWDGSSASPHRSLYQVSSIIAPQDMARNAALVCSSIWSW